MSRFCRKARYYYNNKIDKDCCAFFSPTTENFHTKTQTDRLPNPVFLDMDGVPNVVFRALAENQNANCWLQVRTFSESGEPFPSTAGQGHGPLVSLTQRSDILGKTTVS